MNILKRLLPLCVTALTAAFVCGQDVIPGGGGGGVGEETDPVAVPLLAGKAATNSNLSAFTDDIGLAGLFGDIDTLVLNGCNAAWSGSGLVFNCGGGSYKILGVTYSVAATNVTLATADATHPRLDRLAVTTGGVWTNLTGTAAASPIEPAVDGSTMIARQTALIGANATVPSNTTFVSIYAENSEWTASTNNASITTASASNPRSSSVCVEATSAANNHFANFDKGSTLDRTGVTILNLFIRSKGSWGAKNLSVTWRNSGGTQIGNAVLIGDNRFGFVSTQTASYQQITIPMSAFGLTSLDTVQQLRFTVTGGGANIGFHLDDVSVQTGVAVQTLQNVFTALEGDGGTSITASGPSDRAKFSGGTWSGNTWTPTLSSGAGQLFTTQVNTNGSVTMTVGDIGKLYSYDVTSSPVFTLTNASLFSRGQAIGFLVDSGTTNTLSQTLTVSPAGGDSINSLSNLIFSVKHDGVILVSDGGNKWHPVSLLSTVVAQASNTNTMSIASETDTAMTFDTDDFDPWDLHDTVSNNTRFTVKQEGTYLVVMSGWYNTPTGSYWFSRWVAVNGNNAKRFGHQLEFTNASYTNPFAVMAVVYLRAGDYVEIMTDQYNGGGSRNLESRTATIIMVKQ